MWSNLHSESVSGGAGLEQSGPALSFVESLKTPKGGWTKVSLAMLGVPWLPTKGWKKALVHSSALEHITNPALCDSHRLFSISTALPADRR